MRLPTVFVPFVEEHRLIDAFTDAHPVVMRSKQRVDSRMRRFAGILVDVYYDYLLTNHWHRFEPRSLDGLLTDFYRDIEVVAGELPPQAHELLLRMRDGGWLGSYGSIEGIREALIRVGARMKRPIDLAAAVDELMAQNEDLEADVLEFYPQLQLCVSDYRMRPR
jgi:acyl carrier protein phosphodiesterase